MKKWIPIIILTLLLTGCTVKTGWISQDGHTYYYNEQGDPLPGLQQLEGRAYYFDADGRMCTGWQGQRYFGADGAMRTGELTLEGHRYYLLEDGTRYSGWLSRDGRQYFYDPQGKMLTGWAQVEGKTHYFTQEGAVATGRTVIDGVTYLFDAAGNPISGWQEDGQTRFYTGPDGAMVTGWQEIGGIRCYFHRDGTLATGQVILPEGTYKFQPDGTPFTGWEQAEDATRYYHADGRMAVGPTVIEGITHYFTPTGIAVILVNPWNCVPQDYATQLELVGGFQVSTVCAGELRQMLADCQAAGFSPAVGSGYRSQATQEMLYNNKVQRVQALGYGLEEAKVIAATEVAKPGTSEHQLGLAVDLVDTDNWMLDESQADMPAQKWLMEHCWEYGFILRYPIGTTEYTGIIYEPWHYRYVGREISLELRDLGITLEQYLGAVDGSV